MTEDTPLITDAELKAICEEIVADADTTFFITASHSVIYEYYATSTRFTESRLKLIELYLAAHFAAITNPITAFAGVGKLQESVQYKVGMGLQFTKYGQQALLLSNDTLLKKRASLTWVGTIPRNYETNPQV